MKPFNQQLVCITAFLFLGLCSFLARQDNKQNFNSKATTSTTKIQVAILLDVSNSMDGLIAQAKTQLWNMVSVMGKAKNTEQQAPVIEISLYEYGRSSNNITQGYIRQINSFTTDLDSISQNLFKLSTNGGDEYCTNVILTSLTELTWDVSSSNYKVIFIAGNEDFLQGSVSYQKACDEAKRKRVVINTIYCGDKMQGIKEHWNLPDCGNGSFTNINTDAMENDVPTPYDSLILTYNNKLNSTYIGYGNLGNSKMAAQAAVDQKSFETNKTAALKRAGVKGQKNLYRNSNWDLVDAVDDDSTIITKVDLKLLPAELKNKTRGELKKYVSQKKNERGNIQKELSVLITQREKFLVADRAKSASDKNQPTLESEIEKIIRIQAKEFHLTIEN